MNVTLRFLVEHYVVDENQKVFIYSYDGKEWQILYKGFIYSLIAENNSILDCECSIAEIKKPDMDNLVKNNLKKDYIGIYLV